MKKVTSIFALVICVIMLAGIVCAASDTTTPSVEAKEAPEVEEVVIVSESGEETVVSDFSIDVTSYAAAKTDTTVSVTVKQQIEEAYKEITTTTNLGTLTTELDKVAKEINSGYTANVFVVSDLFDVTVGADIKTALQKGGKVRVTFDTNYTDKPVVLHRSSETGKWEVIDPSKVTIAAGGKVTVEFTSLSPVAFLSISPDKEATPTPTPAKSTAWIWIVVIIVVILVIILIVLLKGKKKENEEEAKEETPAEETAAAEEATAEEAAEEAPAEEAAEEAPAEEATEEAPAEEAAEEAPAEEATEEAPAEEAAEEAPAEEATEEEPKKEQ